MNTREKIILLEKRYGSKAAAADMLGISERTFYRILEGEYISKTLEKLINILAAT